MWAVGEGGFKFQLFGLYKFPKFLQSAKVHMNTEAMSNRNAPKAPKNKSGAARLPAGYEQRWCCGSNDGCGLIRLPKKRQLHVIKEIEVQKGIFSIMTCHIHRQSLTLQFLEKQAGLLGDILMKSINQVNDEDYLNAPRKFQNEQVHMDNVDLEAGNDQPHDATTGSQDALQYLCI